MRQATLLLALSCLGCAIDPHEIRWHDDAVLAEKLLDDRDYEGARARFAELERRAQWEGDRVAMRFRQAEALRRAGRFAEAEAALKELGARTRKDDADRRAKAQYLRARLQGDRGDDAGALRRLHRVVERFPSTVWGHRAFLYLRGHYRESEAGRRIFVRWCRERYRSAPNSAMADNFLYEAARIAFDRETEAGDARALALYEKILARWGFTTSPIWDDAIWEASLIHHRRGRFAAEIDLLERLLSTREETWLGSYEIKNYKWAAFRKAQVLFQDLHAYESAAQAFARIPVEYPLSLLKDDALWWEAHAWQRAGRADLARARFEALLRDWPESKYSRRVRENHPGPPAANR